MRTQFKDRWPGRSFSWDLVVTSPTDTEVRLMQDYSISGFQSILALRLLHQAINHNSYYVEMLADLTSTLNSNNLEISDVSIEAVLDHILQKPVSPSKTAASPILVSLHISETNEWLLDQSSTRTMAIEWVPTVEMPADGLTKPLDLGRHAAFVKLVGMRDLRNVLDPAE